MAMSIFTLVAFFLAVSATVLAFIFIVPEKKRASLNKFLKLLHDTLNFKYLIVEKILQAMYIFATAYVFLLGFLMLFYVEPGYGYYSAPVWHGGTGILIMLLGPIVIRLAYEFMMMVILLVKNVIQINRKLKSENGEAKEDIFKVPQIEKTAKPAAPVCPNCGTKVTSGSFCPNCGNKIS